MKRFLLKSIVFAIVAYCFALGLDWLICRGLLNMEDYRFQDYQAMLEGKMNNEVLIMGNSRGKSHFDTAIIDSLSGFSSFNIGIGGYPINVQLAKYQLYREHNEKPEIIIQNIDFSTLRIVNDIRHQHESEQFFPLVYDPTIRKTLKELGYGVFDLYVPLYRMFGYQQVIKNGLIESLHIKHYISRPSYKGYLPETGKWNGRTLRDMPPEKVVLSDESKRVFSQFLNQCKKDSINVVLVNSPMFYGAQEKLIGYKEARSYFEQVAEEYGYLYLDYTESPMCRDTNNFCVSVHLNARATSHFTEILCKDLKANGIIQ